MGERSEPFEVALELVSNLPPEAAMAVLGNATYAAVKPLLDQYVAKQADGQTLPFQGVLNSIRNALTDEGDATGPQQAADLAAVLRLNPELIKLELGKRHTEQQNLEIVQGTVQPFSVLFAETSLNQEGAANLLNRF